MAAIEDFTEFAAGAAPRLRQAAFLLCGDWHTAEDLTVTTLARMFASWRRISRQDAVYAYASRTLVNAYLAGRRRRRGREVLSGRLPDTAAGPPTGELQMAVLDAPATLPTGARAVAGEPAAGPIVSRSVAAGVRLRRRRRVLGAVTCAAVIAAAGVAVPVLRTASRQAPAPAVAIPPTLYVTSANLDTRPAGGAVTPISVRTGAVGRPIEVGLSSSIISTPDGRTLYVADDMSDWVRPVSTVTGTAGRPIRVMPEPVAMAVTPDGRTLYVASANFNRGRGWVTPISVATGTAGPPIEVRRAPSSMAITPDGKTLYVLSTTSGTVTPISVATGTAGPTTWIYGQPRSMAITPDGKTLYVSQFARNQVISISVAAGKAGRAIKTGAGPGPMVITPDGRTLYVLDVGGVGRTVTPISVATNTARPRIPVGQAPVTLAITPDGTTLYVACVSGTVTPVAVATDTAEPPITVAQQPDEIVITPDGKRAYVLSATGPQDGTVTPIATATNTAGTPITIAGAALGQMVLVP